jgi:hypothetical protein
MQGTVNATPPLGGSVQGPKISAAQIGGDAIPQTRKKVQNVFLFIYTSSVDTYWPFAHGLT